MEDCLALPSEIPGAPQFLQKVELRWGDASLPYSGSKHSHLRGYLRFKAPASDAEGLVALLDVFPSPAIAMLSEPRPASTVTWSAHLLALPSATDEWYAFEYQTVAGLDGFHTVVGRLHNAEGKLLAWSEQLVALFD